MKRILAMILAMTLLLSLAACGKEPDPAVTTTDAPTQATDAPVSETPATEEPTQAPAYTAENQDLVNDENLIFRVTEFADNAHLGLEMHVYCENKTDKTMLFSLDGVSVCGVMYDPFWAEEVTAGKAGNFVIYFDTFQLEEMGIPSVDEISFRLSVIDSDNWMDEPFADESFTVYPTGLTAETVVYPEYQHKNGETVIVDNDQLLFIIEKVADAGDSSYTLNCYIANRTGSDLLVSWDGVSVNGMMADLFWAAAVGAGKQLYTEISFLTSDLEAQGIDDVSDIEFTLSAIDYDSFETVFEEVCAFQPQ